MAWRMGETVHLFCDRVKAWRESQGLTQGKAAKLLGMSYRTYQNLEYKVKSPRRASLAAFSGIGVNVTWLLTGEGPMRLADGAVPEAAFMPPRVEESPAAPYRVGAVNPAAATPPARLAADWMRLLDAEALAQIIEYVEKVGPDRSPAERARLVVRQYLLLIEEGLIPVGDSARPGA